MKSSRILKALTLSMTLFAASNAFGSIATQLLSEDLQAGIKTLPRETRLYHYVNFNSLLKDKTLEKSAYKKPEDRKAWAEGHVARAAGQFWNLSNHNTYLANAGNGLYLALDPYASSPAAKPYTGASFGSTMLEVTFNAGTRYLDLMKDIPLREETIQAIRTETGMSDADAQTLLLSRIEKGGKVSHKGFARDTLQYMAEVQNTAFRKIVYSVFSQNGIAMTEYGWQAGTSALCGTAAGQEIRHHRSALVYVGGPLTQNSIKSVTMVYWDAHAAPLDAQESESLARNKKLYSILEPLRPLELDYRDTADKLYEAKDKATRAALKASLNNILTNINATISSVYDDAAELNEIREKTFECIK